MLADLFLARHFPPFFPRPPPPPPPPSLFLEVELTFGRRKLKISSPTKAGEGLATCDLRLLTSDSDFGLPTKAEEGLRTSYESQGGASDFCLSNSTSDFSLPIRTSDFLRKPRRDLRLLTSDFRLPIRTPDFLRKPRRDFRLRLPIRTSDFLRKPKRDLRLLTSDFRLRTSDWDSGLLTKAEKGLLTSDFDSRLPNSVFRLLTSDSGILRHGQKPNLHKKQKTVITFRTLHKIMSNLAVI